MLEASLSSTVGGVPLLAALHIVGLAFVCLHLALGLAQFGTSWGIVEAKRARRLGTALGLFVFAAGTAAIIHLATGSALPYFRL
jgi:succinate dehydrogenase / fumarate reductase cytochrome b subunit